jgi:IS5 family transposase
LNDSGKTASTMDQMSFGDAEFANKKKCTRREVFLAEMEEVVPWKGLVKLIEPFYCAAERGRRPYPLKAMLRIHRRTGSV